MEIHGRNLEEMYKRSSRYRERSNSDLSAYSDLSYDIDGSINRDRASRRENSNSFSISREAHAESFHTTSLMINEDGFADFQFRDLHRNNNRDKQNRSSHGSHGSSGSSDSGSYASGSVE